MKMGARGFLVKPVSAGKIQALVRAFRTRARHTAH